MEDVKELKNVLERIEEKLIAAENIYGAMNFTFWLAVMTLFYILIGLFGTGFSAIYWCIAIILGIVFTKRIWSRFVKIHISKSDRMTFVLIAFSWMIGSVVGWVIIPSILEAGVETKLATGLLTFISLSLFGQWITLTKGKGGWEMLPSFLLPAIMLPFAWNVERALDWAGFVIALGFLVTIMLYLNSAFRAVEK